jgi:hypothetical protein
VDNVSGFLAGRNIGEAQVATETNTLAAGQFATGRAADHYLTEPLATLDQGDYLLKVEATMGARVAGRALRFVVRPWVQERVSRRSVRVPDAGAAGGERRAHGHTGVWTASLANRSQSARTGEKTSITTHPSGPVTAS